jgi:hypothetical protein
MSNQNLSSSSILAQLISGEVLPEFDVFAFNPYEGMQEYQCEYYDEEYQEEYNPEIHDAPSLNTSINIEDEKEALSIIREYPYICGETIFTWIQDDVSQLTDSYLQFIVSLGWQSNYLPLIELAEKLLLLIVK